MRPKPPNKATNKPPEKTDFSEWETGFTSEEQERFDKFYIRFKGLQTEEEAHQEYLEVREMLLKLKGESS